MHLHVHVRLSHNNAPIPTTTSTHPLQAQRKGYSPRLDDQVVGIVEERTSETYKVNVFSGAPALLNRLAFEGATKRNKPEMKRGDVVYVCLCVCVCVCVPPSFPLPTH